MSVVPYGLLRARGIGVRHSHATGNDCDVTVCELAAVVAEDPALQAAAAVPRRASPIPGHLAEAARDRPRARPAGGGAEVGPHRLPARRRPARTPASLANEDRLVDAFLRDHGILRVDTMAELVGAAELYLKGWRPKGRRLVAISNSGAVCVHDGRRRQRGRHAAAAAVGRDPGRAAAASCRASPTTTNPVDITAALLTNSSLLGAILPVDRPRSRGRCLPGRHPGGRRRLRRRSLRPRFRRLRRADRQAAGRRRAAAASPPASRRRAWRCSRPSPWPWRLCARFIHHHAICGRRPGASPRSTILQRAGKSLPPSTKPKHWTFCWARCPVVRFTSRAGRDEPPSPPSGASAAPSSSRPARATSCTRRSWASCAWASPTRGRRARRLP